MVNFPRSTFTWKAHPWKPDPHYRWSGGFVGEYGQFYHVRFNLEARCEVTEEASFTAEGAETAEKTLESFSAISAPSAVHSGSKNIAPRPTPPPGRRPDPPPAYPHIPEYLQ